MKEKVSLFLMVFLFGAIPRTINYQGKIVDSSGAGVNDTLTMEFRLYTSETGGTPIWVERNNSVVVKQGLFSIELGNINPFPDSVDFSTQYWLEVVAEGEILSPRERLVSAPYAFRARSVEEPMISYSSERDTTRRRGSNIVFRAGEGVTLEDDGRNINITLSVTGGGSGGVIPTIYDVLVAGADAGGRGIVNLADPTAPQDAATKNYVDNYSVSSILGGAALSPDEPTMGDVTINVKYDNSTIGVNSLDQIYVKIGGIGSEQIADGSIQSVDIAPGTIITSNIAPGAITSDRIAPGAVGSEQIADSAIIMAHLADFYFPAAHAGDILYFNGSRWVNLPAGSPGQYLRTDGPGSSPSWETPAARAIYNFILAASPSSGRIPRGDSATATISVTEVRGESPEYVKFYAAGLPSGVTSSFTPDSCLPSGGPPRGCTSTMKIRAAGSAQAGTYAIPITGISTSGASATAIYTANIGVPAKVTTINIYANPCSIYVWPRITWVTPDDGGSPITHYNIYRSTSSGNEVYYTYVSAPTTVFNDTLASPETTYYYQVSAVNAVGEGDRSGEVSTTVGRLKLSCKAILDAGCSVGDGVYWIDPNGGSPSDAFQAYCDMTTDGGGWTIVAAYTGADNEQPLVSDTERLTGNPLLFQHYNINRAKKMAISAVSTQSLFKRNNNTWIRVNRSMFDNNLNTPNTCTHWSVTITANNGASASGYMGYSNYNYSGGGDFGITTTAGFDHHSTTYWHLNGGCANMYLYSYSNASSDYDAGYDVNTSLGSWSATVSCDSYEGGSLVFWAGMR